MYPVVEWTHLGIWASIKTHLNIWESKWNMYEHGLFVDSPGYLSLIARGRTPSASRLKSGVWSCLNLGSSRWWLFGTLTMLVETGATLGPSNTPNERSPSIIDGLSVARPMLWGVGWIEICQWIIMDPRLSISSRLSRLLDLQPFFLNLQPFEAHGELFAFDLRSLGSGRPMRCCAAMRWLISKSVSKGGELSG